MRRATFIPALILIYALGAFTPIQAQERVTNYLAELLFDLAELHYPELFSTNEPTVVQGGLHLNSGNGFDITYYWGWFYRYYPESTTYLAVNGIENAVYVFGPYFGPEIVNVGRLDEVLRLFPSGMTMSHSDQCVEVGSPEPEMTAYHGWSFYPPAFGLPNAPHRPDGDSVVSWQPGANGGTEVLTHHGSFLNYLHLYTEKELVTSNAGLNYLESSSRNYNAGNSFLKPDWGKASEATQYSPGLLLGPSSRYCVGQAWLSAPVAKSSTYSYFPTTSAKPMPPSSSQTETALTVSYVVSVNTRINVQAGGEFETVEIVTNGHRRWIDVESGILVAEGPDYIYDYPYYNLTLEYPDYRASLNERRELFLLQTSGPCTLVICARN